AFSPDDKRIVTGSFDGTAKVWDAETGRVILTFKEHKLSTSNVSSAACSPDGQVDLFPYPDAVSSVSFSPDGERIVSGSDNGVAKVWDATTGHVTLTLRHSRSYVRSVAFSPD